MPLASIEDAARDVRDGKMIIVVDDEDRENEGDLVCAAEKVTPDAICTVSVYDAEANVLQHVAGMRLPL